jgi:raffinose/stachyose/melibiose transport system permease protein
MFLQYTFSYDILRGDRMKSRKHNLSNWLFLLPALFFFANVVIIPFIIGVVYSFSDWGGFSFAGSHFAGFKNYMDAFTDSDFLSAFARTFFYAAIMVILVNVVGFMLALLVTQNIRTNNILRSVYFLPNLIGGLILGFIWQFIFSKLFVTLGQTLHMQNTFFDWLTVPNTAFISLIMVGTWQMAGYVMIIYIAGLQSIPTDVIEASKIDGAGPFQRLRTITIPLMMPSFTVSLFLVLSNSFKQYDTNLSLTNGGPYGTTELLAMNIYQTAFNHNEYALSQAKSMILFMVIVVVTLIQVHVTSKHEVEN